jgi:hypothetical protein
MIRFEDKPEQPYRGPERRSGKDRRRNQGGWGSISTV